MLLADFAPLTPAEEAMVAGAPGDGRIVIGEALPEGEDDTLRIRAGLIRLALTGADPGLVLNDKGLRLKGARIEGVLDLRSVTTRFDLALTSCHLTDPAEMMNARMRGIYLSDCYLPGIEADGAVLDGSFYIRGETLVKGELSLAGMRVEGDIQFCGLAIKASGQDAIFAPSLSVGGSVYLGDYPYANGRTTLDCEGAVFMASSRIGRDLFVTRCAIAASEPTGESLFQASEEHGPENALSLARANIGGILYFRENQIARGAVSLAGAHAARLRDEPAGPGASYPVRLDGFTYDDFSRHAETGIGARLEWLARRPRDTAFTAQPYEQFARTLDHMGHRSDARTVRMTKERVLREADREKLRARHGRGLRWWLDLAGDVIMRFGVGYGYRPGRALVIAVVMIAGLTVFFDRVWQAGDMAPNAAPILVSAGWQAAVEAHPDNPAAFWAAPGQAGQDYETFNALAYAADVFVPLVSLGQEAAWAPSTARSPLGRIGWWLRWIATALGWVVTALGAAAVTGAVRQD
ncbi:hypothetical protein ATO6_04535 [Oceanicola sp. 22II-s10i]|nr:hypothetical protein ATO6_04535 [Oceanicola sp. 22II-s10i]